MPDLPGKGGLLVDTLANLDPSVPYPGPRRGMEAQSVGLTPGGPAEPRVLNLQFRKHTHQWVLALLFPCQPARPRATGWYDTHFSGLGVVMGPSRDRVKESARSSRVFAVQHPIQRARQAKLGSISPPSDQGQPLLKATSPTWTEPTLSLGRKEAWTMAENGPFLPPPQTQVGVLQPWERVRWDRTSYKPSPRHKPGLGAEELTVTQPAEEGVVEAVPEKKHRLWAEGK